MALVRDASSVTGISSTAPSSVPSPAVASPTSPLQPARQPSSHNASSSQNHTRASSLPQYSTIRASVAAAATTATTAAAKISKAAKAGAKTDEDGNVASAPPRVRRRPSTMTARRATFCALNETAGQQLPPTHGHKHCASTSSFPLPPPLSKSGSPQAFSHLTSFRGTASHVIRAEGEPAPMSFSALAMQVCGRRGGREWESPEEDECVLATLASPVIPLNSFFPFPPPPLPPSLLPSLRPPAIRRPRAALHLGSSSHPPPRPSLCACSLLSGRRQAVLADVAVPCR